MRLCASLWEAGPGLRRWIGVTWKTLDYWSSRIHFVVLVRGRENRELQLAGACFQPCQLISWRPTRWERIYHTTFRGSGIGCCPVSGTWEFIFCFLFSGGCEDRKGRWTLSSLFLIPAQFQPPQSQLSWTVDTHRQAHVLKNNYMQINWSHLAVSSVQYEHLSASTAHALSLRQRGSSAPSFPILRFLFAVNSFCASPDACLRIP